jgi:hypothetical protein
MPRISLWREDKANDYKFIDRRISEMFTVGGTGIMVHKYIGSSSEGNDGSDVTKPAYNNQSALNLQDLLFVENRDRKYDTSVYKTRGIYQRQDQDFSLSQFGIFLAEGTLFMTFHLNDIVETLGRKLIAGDVLELMHLKDDWGIDNSVPFALKRYYVVGDASFASEGFSPTWYPHLWRVKLSPLVDSQEYKDILDKIGANSDPFAGNVGSADNPALSSIVSTYEKYKNINDAIIEQAEIELPRSGYDTSNLFTVGRNNTTGQLGDPVGAKTSGVTNVSSTVVTKANVTVTATNTNRVFVDENTAVVIGAGVRSTNLGADTNVTVVSVFGSNGVLLSANTSVTSGEEISFIRAGSTALSVDAGRVAPSEKVKGYLGGDGTAPNGLTVAMGITFPSGAISGDYFLRLDFVPNRLFRYDGRRWVKIEDAVRTNITPGSADNRTMRNSFFNNDNTFSDSAGNERKERQSLSKAFTPKADN